MLGWNVDRVVDIEEKIQQLAFSRVSPCPGLHHWPYSFSSASLRAVSLAFCSSRKS